MAKQLNKNEIKQLNQQIAQEYGIQDFFGKKENVKMDSQSIFLEEETIFFKYEEKFIPTLKLIMKQENQQKQSILKKIIVDMGAIKFAANGADIMRPGIVKIEPKIAKGEAVCIIDETHSKPLAIGIALYTSEEMISMEKGKAVKSIHHIGDEIWTS